MGIIIIYMLIVSAAEKFSIYCFFFLHTFVFLTNCLFIGLSLLFYIVYITGENIQNRLVPEPLGRINFTKTLEIGVLGWNSILKDVNDIDLII